MTIQNIALATDSYKFSHFLQYPHGAQRISSYIESRGSSVAGENEVVFFGLQAFINEVLKTPATRQDIEDARLFCQKHGLPFNYDDWMIIVNEHNGYIPVRIEAVPEGTPVTVSNVMAQVVNTDDRLPWVTSYIETLMLSYIWYGSTVATVSRHMKKTIKRYLDKTSDNAEQELPFKLHDFGYRGVAAGAAGLGSAGHLVNFMGTDTVAGIQFAMKNYNADMCGFSISASEHSTITSWGQEDEFSAYQNMVNQYAKPGATFACVIDSYDTVEAIRMWADRGVIDLRPSLLDQVKEAGATVVLRPDSGDPVQMPIKVIKELMHLVGFYVNSKGYKVLPDHVRVIQGDGIDHNDVEMILKLLEEQRISVSNITFGMGGGLLQKVNRDTFRFAMKASAILINDEWHDVVKNPITDTSKKSKAGRLVLLHDRKGNYSTVRVDEHEFMDDTNLAMRVVYESKFGNVYHRTFTFDEVRKNAEVK